MLKYVGSSSSSHQSSSSGSGDISSSKFDKSISTRIVVSDTDVQHSGTYNCEPGAAPVASVNVHVLDGKNSLARARLVAWPQCNDGSETRLACVVRSRCVGLKPCRRLVRWRVILLLQIWCRSVLREGSIRSMLPQFLQNCHAPAQTERPAYAAAVRP